MACCGNQRKEWSPNGPAGSMPAGNRPGTPPAAPGYTGVYFEYTGTSALTVRGPFSGRIYRFDGPGKRILVDRRDGRAFRSIPHLRMI